MTQVNIYNKAIADFEELYPNIKINMRLYTDYGRIYNDVITNIATNTTPNICITYPDHIATYLTGNNTVVALDSLLEDTNYGLKGEKLRFEKIEAINDRFLEECKINDSYYALPFMRSSEALYINKTYVEKLGYEIPEAITWDFIWEVADAATLKDSDDNYLVNEQKVMIPFIYKSTDNMMIQMLHQRGGAYSKDDGTILIFNDTTKDILDEIASHVINGAFSTFKISSYPANFLNAGQCLFAIDSTAGATWMGSNAPLIDISEDKLVQFETVVSKIPQINEDEVSMISQGPSICIFNKDDENEVLASWLFMEYLLSNEVQIAYAETEGYIPVTQDAINSKEYQEYLSLEGIDNNEHYDIKIKASKILLENIDNTFVTPVFNGSTSLRDAAGQMIENTVKAIRRHQELDYDDLFKEMNALYHLDQTSIVATGSDLGPLPSTAVYLIVGLITVWILIGGYALNNYLKRKKI